MTTRHLVDPELRPLLDQIPKRTFTRDRLAQVRASQNEIFRAAAAILPPVSGVKKSARNVPGRLQLSTSSVSRSVAKLEHDLGIVLFERRTRSVIAQSNRERFAAPENASRSRR